MIKKSDKILHPKYGKGHILHIQYRPKSSLYTILYETGSLDWYLKEDVLKYKDEDED